MNNFLKKFFTKTGAEAPELAPILLVGGERFFCDKLLLHEEVSPKNLDSFLEMNLEALSPFPIEQLYWGYLHDKKKEAVLLYAMYSETLSSDEKATLLSDEISYVFPSFIAGYGQKFTEPTISFISAGGSLSALFWNTEDTIPLHIETVILRESVEQGRGEILQMADTEGYGIQPGYWELEKIELLPNKSVRFESTYHSNELSKEKHVLVLNEKDSSTWNADIRPKFLTKEKHKQERMARILWLGVLSAIGIFAIFIILEILGFVGKGYLASKKAHFKSQEAQVKLIEGQESLVQKIEHLGHNYYAPLKLLELLNNYRPKKVYFTSVVLGNKNDVVIEGVAQSVDDLNKYTDDLNASGLIEKFEVGQIVSRQGRITFKMDVTFKISEKGEGAPVS